MNKKMIRLVSVVLALALLLTLFAGCGKDKEDENIKIPDAAAAIPVDYSRSGQYRTTVTPVSEDIDLSSVTADKIEISCYPPSEDAPVIDSVTANGSGLDIAFTDNHAADNLTSDYFFTFEDI